MEMVSTGNLTDTQRILVGHQQSEPALQERRFANERQGKSIIRQDCRHEVKHDHYVYSGQTNDGAAVITQERDHTADPAGGPGSLPVMIGHCEY